MIINVDFSNLTVAEANWIRRAIETCPLYTTLWLTNECITDAGAKAVADALPTFKLRELVFWGTEITNVGGLALLRAVPRSNVECITFYNSHVTGEIETAINLAIAARPYRNKLFLLPRLRFFEFTDGDHAMLNRVAQFLWR